MKGALTFALFAISLVCWHNAAMADTGFGGWITGGIATFYGGAPDGMDPNSPSFGTLNGACGFGTLDKNSWPGWNVAGIATSNRFYSKLPGNACGACFEIQCVDPREGACNPARKTVTVTVTDECPECGADHWDIQALTFAQIATPAVGRVAIQYRRVACRPPKDMELHIDSNRGAGGWMRLFVSDVANLGTVQAVSIGSSGSWYNLNNIWGAAWELGWTPAPPLDLRITDEAGKQLVARAVITVSGQVGVMPLGVQFSVEGGGDVAAPPPPAAATNASAPTPKAAPPAPITTPAASSGSCADVPIPDSLFSCAQQQQWGKCNEDWMVLTSSAAPQGYCAATCGRCSVVATPPAPAPTSSNTTQPASNTTQPGPAITPPPPVNSTVTPQPAKPAPAPPVNSPSPSPAAPPVVVSQKYEEQCTDNAPDGRLSCAEQAKFKKCEEPWMIGGNFCRRTCGKC